MRQPGLTRACAAPLACKVGRSREHLVPIFWRLCTFKAVRSASRVHCARAPLRLRLTLMDQPARPILSRIFGAPGSPGLPARPQVACLAANTRDNPTHADSHGPACRPNLVFPALFQYPTYISDAHVRTHATTRPPPAESARTVIITLLREKNSRYNLLRHLVMNELLRATRACGSLLLYHCTTRCRLR